MSDRGSRTVLREATDAHFAWMLGETPSIDDLTLPPGGVGDNATLVLLQASARKFGACGRCLSWLIVSGNEVVGLCGFKEIPHEGIAEIGYGIAFARRNLGHASRAVREFMAEISDDPTIHTLVAETPVTNIASQLVLARNGFKLAGERADAEDGELLLWRRPIRF